MATTRKKPSNIKPSEAQLKARAKFAEQARSRAGYSLEVKCNDQVFTCKTKDLAEAIGALNIARFKTRTFITVKKGGKTFTRILNVPMAKKVLKNPQATRFFAIGIDKFFKY